MIPEACHPWCHRIRSANPFFPRNKLEIVILSASDKDARRTSAQNVSWDFSSEALRDYSKIPSQSGCRTKDKENNV